MKTQWPSQEILVGAAMEIPTKFIGQTSVNWDDLKKEAGLVLEIWKTSI